MITVIGLGKLGLPLAVHFARKNFEVLGVDIDEKIIQQVNLGKTENSNEANLVEYLAEVVQNGKLRASSNLIDSVKKSNVIIVTVPLFLNEDFSPDFKILDEVSLGIGKGLQRGSLVIYETTVPVGTTHNRYLPILEKFSNLKIDEDFFLAFSPERVLTGRIFKDLSMYPKLVGGVSEESTRKAKGFYSSAIDFEERFDLLAPNGVWTLENSEAAEFAKLAETTYRDVNIALANQFAFFAAKQSLNFESIAGAANSQPFSHIHSAGISVGGHCIPVYPHLYLWRDSEASLVKLAREINEKLIDKYLEIFRSMHGNLTYQKVVILGLTYRRGVKETYNSGVYDLVKILEKFGADVKVHDPLFQRSEIEKLGFKAYKLGEPVDGAILHTAHIEYASLIPNDLPGIRTMLDGRDILDVNLWKKIKYYSVSRK